MSKIFISYRRDDSRSICDAIYKRLTDRFGASDVFRDTSSIPYGVDYRQYIQQVLEQCSIQLVIIGPHRATISHGQRPRLDDPDDLVRIEVETALKHELKVVPVLVEGAALPAAQDLPASLRPLLDRNGEVFGEHPEDEPKFDGFLTKLAQEWPLNPQADGWKQIITPRMDELTFRYRRINGKDVVLPPVHEVKAGQFTMGDPQGMPDTQPHPVTTAHFLIAVYPVTAAEYGCFVRAGHAPPPDRGVYWVDQLGRKDHPIVNVSWHDAVAYAAWLASITGQNWRLPTEAEWEKAAGWESETGAMREYPWGRAFDASRCNTQEGGRRSTTSVGAYGNRGASPCGAQDLAGNVWEWTASLYRPYPYKATDGRERLDAPGARVRRGGSWNSVAANARCAKRAWDDSGKLDQTIGFRLALGATS
jgi:formylglycine-generating enzyme required for sulfatase activity